MGHGDDCRSRARLCRVFAGRVNPSHGPWSGGGVSPFGCMLTMSFFTQQFHWRR
jgi:hypothetical protein